MVVAAAGSALGPQNLVALALTFAWCSDVQSTFMPSAANALKLHDYYTHRRNGGLAVAIGLAVVVSFVATTSFMIYLCYDYGRAICARGFSMPLEARVVGPSTGSPSRRAIPRPLTGTSSAWPAAGRWAMWYWRFCTTGSRGGPCTQWGWP